MRILITGGAGHVARIYRTHIGGAHQLRLLDHAPIADIAPHEQALAGALDDLALVQAACAGVDAVSTWPPTATPAPTSWARCWKIMMNGER
jgi:uronate dehydrogenase